MKSWKSYLYFGLVFTVGLAVGATVAGRVASEGLHVQAVTQINERELDSISTFHDSPPRVAIWTANRLIEELDQSKQILSKTDAEWVRMLVHCRLAILHREIEDDLVADEHANEALLIAQQNQALKSKYNDPAKIIALAKETRVF